MISFEKLKEIREDNDISQQKMSNILGVKRSTYSLWELGINIIPIEYLSSFADYFNCSIDYILGLSNNKDTNNLLKGLDYKIIGKNIKKIRKSHGLSQENLANMLGVTQACIARYEKGLISISLSSLYKISKEFNIQINEICGKITKKELSAIPI